MRFAKGRRLRLAAVFLLSAVVTSGYSATEERPVDWIRNHAIRLQTVEAGHGFDDMQPLAKIVGNARIVALGEATHGTREFFQLKHRMIEFLATQKGFTIFSIEANMPEAYRLNDFVLNGTGDPKQLLKGMHFWTWDTEEFLDMILWMREFNRSGKGRIEFTGFDMQNPNASMDIVRSFVTEHNPSYLDTLNGTYSDVVVIRKAEVGKASSAEQAQRSIDKKQVAQACAAILEKLQSNRGTLLKSASVWDVDWAIHNAELVVQYVQLQAGEQSRDQSMAENVEWIADHNPGAKIILWAANGHVRYVKFPDFTPMGRYLHERFGNQMINFGFSFNQGSFRAIGTGRIPSEFTVAPLPEGSLDRTLASAGIPLFALDLRQLPRGGPVARWFAKPRAMRNIGGVYSEKLPDFPDPIATTQWPEAFDAILFVEKTTAAQENP